jgi:hypothetical protein
MPSLTTTERVPFQQREPSQDPRLVALDGITTCLGLLFVTGLQRLRAACTQALNGRDLTAQ